MTERKKLEKKLEDLITEKLKEKYHDKDGYICQICGKHYKDARSVGQFHVLSKGNLPNLKYRPEDIIQAGWWCCHFPSHHDYYKARDVIVPLLKKLLGDDYEERLKLLSARLPKTTLDVIYELYHYWENL